MPKMFRLTVQGDFGGVNWYNTFHYQSDSEVSGQASSLIGAWKSEFINAFMGVQNPASTLQAINVVDVPDTGDYAVTSEGAVGSFGSIAAQNPPWYTYLVMLNTSGSVIRHGYKRISGTDEGAYTSGIPSSIFLTAMGVLLPKFSAILNGGTMNFTPMVVRYAGDPSAIVLSTPITGAVFRRASWLKSRLT